jgi:hypothetical protein
MQDHASHVEVRAVTSQYPCRDGVGDHAECHEEDHERANNRFGCESRLTASIAMYAETAIRLAALATAASTSVRWNAKVQRPLAGLSEILYAT